MKKIRQILRYSTREFRIYDDNNKEHTIFLTDEEVSSYSYATMAYLRYLEFDSRAINANIDKLISCFRSMGTRYYQSLFERWLVDEIKVNENFKNKLFCKLKRAKQLILT